MDDVLDAQGAGMDDGEDDSEAVSGQWSASAHTTDVDGEDDSDMDEEDMAALHGGDEKEDEIEILADDGKVKKKEDYPLLKKAISEPAKDRNPLEAVCSHFNDSVEVAIE